MNNNISKTALNIFNAEISNSMDSYKKYSNDHNYKFENNKENFYRFILKKIYLFQKLNLSYNKESYDVLSQLIADLLDLIKFNIEFEERSFYLTLRSIIESYTKLVLASYDKSSNVTSNLFENLKNEYLIKNIINKNDFSKIKNYYKISSKNIHANITNSNNHTINLLVNNYIFKDNSSTNISNKNLSEIQNLITIFEKCFIYKYKENINNCFVRENIVLNKILSKNNYKNLKS